MSRRNRVLIVDDHEVVRSGVSTLINQTDDLHICGEATGFESAIDAVKRCNPDVALVDISLGEHNGLDLIRKLKAVKPNLRVLVLSMHDESVHAERALMAGSSGYVMKASPTSQLLQAIRDVLHGKLYMSPDIADRLLEKAARGRKAESTPFGCLSERETKVLELTGRGFMPRQIASELNLSVKTVESHLQNTKKKLALKNSSELRIHAADWTAHRH